MKITFTGLFGLGRGIFITIKERHLNLYTNSNHELWFNNKRLIKRWNLWTN